MIDYIKGCLQQRMHELSFTKLGVKFNRIMSRAFETTVNGRHVYYALAAL